MTRIAISQSDYCETKESFEKIIGESKTIPNQSLTVEEVLNRFQGGTLPSISHPTNFDNLDDFDSFDPTSDPSFDLADATILQSRLTAFIAEKTGAQLAAKQNAEQEGGEVKQSGAPTTE